VEKKMLTNISNIDNYYSLLKSLPINEKLELINKISSSISEDINNKQNTFYKCFGKLITKKSADEIINDIYTSRYFSNKDIKL
jgi:hypothetical protein